MDGRRKGQLQSTSNNWAMATDHLRRCTEALKELCVSAFNPRAYSSTPDLYRSCMDELRGRRRRRALPPIPTTETDRQLPPKPVQTGALCPRQPVTNTFWYVQLNEAPKKTSDIDNNGLLRNLRRITDGKDRPTSYCPKWFVDVPETATSRGVELGGGNKNCDPSSPISSPTIRPYQPGAVWDGTRKESVISTTETIYDEPWDSAALEAWMVCGNVSRQRSV